LLALKLEGSVGSLALNTIVFSFPLSL